MDMRDVSGGRIDATRGSPLSEQYLAGTGFRLMDIECRCLCVLRCHNAAERALSGYAQRARHSRRVGLAHDIGDCGAGNETQSRQR